jgi:nitrogen-specific signal transduction histidine kinase/integral membrane sensor domain MASE1
MDQLTQRVSYVPRADPWRAIPTPLQAALIVAAGYYLGALVGFRLRFPSSGISFFWPPTAVLTAALLLGPPGAWRIMLPAAFAAHAAAHAQNGVPTLVWPIQFLANAVQALLAASLIRRYSDSLRPFRDLQRATAFIIGACVVAPAVSSVLAASVYLSQGWAANFMDAWSARTVSNAIAALTLVPPIVMIWPQLWSGPTLPPARRVFEFVVVIAGILAAHTLVRQVEGRDSLALSLALYAPAPFLLWATVRFGGPGLSVTVLATTLMTISSALRSEGAFASETPLEAVVHVQLFIAITAVPLILIAGLLEQNRDEHRALLEMERQNSATLRALPDLMFLQTRDGLYLQHYARNRSELLVPPEAFLGKNMREVLPPDLADKFVAAFRVATADEPSMIDYSLEINGLLRHYEARVIAIDGDRVLSIVRDITDRWRSEDALKHANDALVRMGRVSALAELSASIAHELNQPLTAIASNASACLRWIASGTTDGDLRGALKDVVSDSHRASQIVQRTKEMFTNRAVEKTVVDLNEIVRDVIELTWTRLRKDDVRLEVDLDSRIPAVEADAIQIKQVLLNLILNAADAMEDVRERPRVLRIASGRDEHGAVIIVCDTGTGFHASDLERLFEPFYTTKADGIGIGLAISRSIVDSHGGMMWAEANPTGGATFRFSLPAHDVARPAITSQV